MCRGYLPALSVHSTHVFHGVDVMSIFTLSSFSYFSQNLRNEEQVAIIQASTVLSLAEKVMSEVGISSHPVLSS